MLRSRRLLSLAALACAAAALLAPTAATAAISQPVTPVLTGGKVTYSGGVSGTLTSSNAETEEYYNEHANVDWSATSYVGDLYGGLSIFGDGGAGAKVESYTSVPGGGTVSARFRNWDPVKGYTWKTLSCKNGGNALVAPNPGRAFGGKLQPASVGFIDFATNSTCDNANNTGKTGSGIGTHIVGVIAATQVSVGGTPPAVGAKDFEVPLNDDAPCPPNGLSNCRYSYSGKGTVHVECAVCLTSVTLEQRDGRTGNLEDVPAAGTTDGNRVFVEATFTNTSPYTIQSLINVRERVSKRKLIDAGGGAGLETFPAGATKKVVFEWDTSGFAWEKGKPSSDRELEIRNGMGGGYVKVKVLPKPVIAVHGWNADYHGWDTAKDVIPQAIHPGLKGRVYAVGDENAVGTMNTDPDTGNSIAQNAAGEAMYIQAIRERTDAEHVDLVVHSMGGLISRYYIQKLMPMARDGMPVASHLVMLGTPNMGSPCANVIGLVAKGVPTDQLKPEYVEGVFNKQILDRKGVPFSLMAGDIQERTCTSPRHGDVVVELESAYWTLADVAKTYAHHVELTDLDFIYSGFVKKRLGVDPDEALNPTQGGSGSGAGLAARSTRSTRAATADAAQAGLVQTVSVPAGGSVDVPVAVASATGLLVASTAPSGVTSELRSPSGAVVDTVAAGSVDAREVMRFQRAEAPATGTWTLRLTQPGGSAAAKVGIVAAFEGSPLKLVTSSDGNVVRATVTNAGAGLAGATVKAELRADGQPTRTVTLRDEGAGKYRADAGALPAGDWFGTVHAATTAGERYGDVMLGGTAPGEPGPGGGGDGGGQDDGGAGNQSTPGPSTTGPGATPPGANKTPTPTPVRAAGTTARLTLTATATRDRRAPYRFTLRGKLTTGGACPAGAKVAVAITAGRRTVGKATVKVGKACAFTATVKVAKRGRLRAAARTIATAKVPAAVSAPLALRAG